MPENNIDVSSLLEAMREIKDEKDRVNQHLKRINEAEEKLERDILDAMTSLGFVEAGDKVSSACGTATRQVKWRAKYEPDKWPEIVKWMAEQGRTDLVQRRLSDAKIMELVDLGQPLPDGLGVESFEQLSFRRA